MVGGNFLWSEDKVFRGPVPYLDELARTLGRRSYFDFTGRARVKVINENDVHPCLPLRIA